MEHGRMLAVHKLAVHQPLRPCHWQLACQCERQLVPGHWRTSRQWHDRRACRTSRHGWRAVAAPAAAAYGCTSRAAPSSRGPGHRPFTAATRVRIPLGSFLPRMPLPPDLKESYLRTAYTARTGDGSALVIRVGRRHPELDALLAETQASSWAFITAWNPWSRQLSEEANR